MIIISSINKNNATVAAMTAQIIETVIKIFGILIIIIAALISTMITTLNRNAIIVPSKAGETKFIILAAIRRSGRFSYVSSTRKIRNLLQN